MENKNVFTVDELIKMNEFLLGRGMPVVDDGIGYNKADYSVCSNYYYGLSNSQVADLSKRLVKYCKTQLNVDKEKMKETFEHYNESAHNDRKDGVSLEILEEHTIIAFHYNELFISILKNRPKRKFDVETRNWLIPNGDVLNTLEILGRHGADTENAVKYASNNKYIINATPQVVNKQEIEFVDCGDTVNLRFKYNQDIINAIKTIHFSNRKWNPEKKIWNIAKKELDWLIAELHEKFDFKKVS